MTEWENTTLGKLCKDSGGNIQTGPFGSQLHASDYVPIGIPSIMPQNIGDNRVTINGIARITDADAKRLSRYLVKPGDIVYSRRGDVERRALIRETEEGWLCGTGCLRVRFGDKKPISSTFVSYYLDAPNIRMWIVQHAIGATMPNLNTAILSDVPVLLPPYHEQKAIAEILSAIDNKIALSYRMNQTLEAIAQALFKSWFVDFDPVRAKAEGRRPEGMDDATAALFPSSFIESPLGPIPHGWRIGNIKELCQRVESGGTPSRKEKAYWDNGTIPWLTSSEVRQKVILDTEEKITERGLAESNAKIWPSMSTVVAMYGATAGQVTLLANSVSANQACCALIPKSYTQSFVFLKAARSVEIYERQARGSAQQNLNKSIVADLRTVVPPQIILEEFENIVSSLIVSIIQGFKENIALSELRDLLLPRLISGKLRISDLSKETATS